RIRCLMARWTSSSGTATMSGLREPQSTPHPTGKPGKGDQFPDWSTARGTTGACAGTTTGSNSGEITLTVRIRTFLYRRSPSQSTAIPATCGGRSTTPAIGFRPCSPWQSVGPAAAILPRVVSSRQPCSSTGYEFGSSPLRLDHLNQVELPALDKPEAQAIRDRKGRCTAE